jgi:hypothetical protein
MLRRRDLAMLLAAALPAGRAAASALPAPTERPVLTIDGRISAGNQPDGTLRLDMPTLESLGLVRFTTATPWYDTPSTFEGVPMAALMRAAGANGETLTVRALNQYTTEIPIADFRQHAVILATRRDGQRMPVRDKGPLFIVYDFGASRALWNERYFARSAWSVARMTVG